MADESVKTAFGRLLATIDEASPYLKRLVDDHRAAVAAVLANEERKEMFAKDGMAKLRELAEDRAAVTALGPFAAAMEAIASRGDQDEPVAEQTKAPEPTAPAHVADEDANPFIDNDPKAWIEAKGAKGSMKGMRLSECPLEYLDMMIAGLEQRAAFFERKKETAKAEADRKLIGYARAQADMLRPKPKHQAEHRSISADDVLKGRAK